MSECIDRGTNILEQHHVHSLSMYGNRVALSSQVEHYLISANAMVLVLESGTDTPLLASLNTVSEPPFDTIKVGH